VEEAGRKLIEVTDNGLGIPENEITLAVERYATSKITQAEDLEQIHTLGFRGEALASISAVSRFMIASKTDSAESGHVCEIEGGVIIAQKSVGMPAGTKVTVRDLFFNVPARLKFLKADRTEKQHINRVISRYALQYADIRFILIQDGKTIISSGDDMTVRTWDIESAEEIKVFNFTKK
jgi:DNA mismatch repair protein MutL